MLRTTVAKEGKQKEGKYLQSLLHGRDEPVEHQDGDTRAQEQQNIGLELNDSITTRAGKPQHHPARTYHHQRQETQSSSRQLTSSEKNPGHLERASRETPSAWKSPPLKSKPSESSSKPSSASSKSSPDEASSESASWPIPSRPLASTSTICSRAPAPVA